MASKNRGHRPNGDFQTDEEMHKEKQRQRLKAIVGLLTVVAGALAANQAGLLGF